MKNLTIFLILFIILNTTQAENWKLDARFAGFEIKSMVKKSYPSLSEQATKISHYAGYYSINPFLLSEYVLKNNGEVAQLARDLSALINQKQALSLDLDKVKQLMSMQHIPKQQLKASAANRPVLDLPFDHDAGWRFNGVHTWTGADNGDPMSSIDMTKSWGLDWGDDTSNDWVAAAHNGIVSNLSSCFVRITHESGWATDYYHLDNSQFSTGQTILAGQKFANYADNREQALCMGGSSSGPHVHFALVKDGSRYDLSEVELSLWKIHPGSSSYDSSIKRMWLEKNGVRKYAYRDIIQHINGDNTIDYRYSGVYSSQDISGHGINITITQFPATETTLKRDIVFIAFYTYDNEGNANFYVGNIDFENWRSDDSKTIPIIQTSGGDFTNLQAIDFSEDVTDAGSMTLKFNSCNQIEVEFSLLEPINNEIIEHQLVLSKSVGIPDDVCEAMSEVF